MFEYEEKYSEFGLVAGMDEAGRGPLAGPVVCACVIMPLDEDKRIDGVNDSKKLTPKKREALFDKIINTAISYSIIEVDEKTIDKINILEATKLGFRRALDNMSVKPSTILIDALTLNSGIREVGIIHGDSLSYNIAAASILAKVYRDRKMVELSRNYPEYHFEKHKGYGTKEHIELLNKYGKCEIHRDSFIKHFV